MSTYTVEGKAVILFIRAESKEAAEKIFFAPLAEVANNLTGVWFERKTKKGGF